MTLEKAFELINNLDVREAIRKFSPQWSTVAVDESGEIIDVIRHKESPSIKLHREHMNKYPRSAQFTAWPGRFKTVEELAETVKESAWVRKNY